MNLRVHQFLVSFFEKQHLYSPMICLADWPIVVHFVVLSFLCNIWTYYCRLSPGTSWLFVSIVFWQFDSQSPSLSSNDSFSILINFFDYFNFSFISFIGCTGFLRLFVCFCFLFCSVSSLLFSFLSLHLRQHCYIILFFLWFSHSFCILSSTFAHIYLYLFSFCLYIFWF